MIILEQGTPEKMKGSLEQRKILKRSMEQEKNHGVSGKLKMEQGAPKNEKAASEKGAMDTKLKGPGSKGENSDETCVCFSWLDI